LINFHNKLNKCHFKLLEDSRSTHNKPAPI